MTLPVTAGRLARLSESARARCLAALSPEQLLRLRYDWSFWARPEQLAPNDDGTWNTWLIDAGRGFGKTRTGVEWVRGRVEEAGARFVIIVGPTASDIRDIIIEGESGLLACSPPWFRPLYEPSKASVTWPNGAKALLISAEEPDRARGKQSDTIYGDELGSWKYPEVWDMLRLGHRLGHRYGVRPRACVTTTPRPTRLFRRLLKDSRTRTVRGSSYDNVANLDPEFVAQLRRIYEGTRLGRQEIYAELLEDLDGALWSHGLIDACRVGASGQPSSVPDLVRTLVAVDPSTTSKATSNETGIVGVGRGTDDHAYVLADYSGRMSPDAWAMRVVFAYDELQASAIVYESNQGGDLVESTIRAAAPGRTDLRFKAVYAAEGKRTRAEPVAALYEQKRVHHVGTLGKLEDCMCGWDPITGKMQDDPESPDASDSPDRMDALVWGITELQLNKPSTVRSYDPYEDKFDDES